MCRIQNHFIRKKKKSFYFFLNFTFFPPIFIMKITTVYFFFSRCGDMLLSVNDQSLKHVTHADAVTLLKNASGFVTLEVVSWPGTFV